jgi:acetoin utilization deacetylase AcuC-like enzyme
LPPDEDTVGVLAWLHAKDYIERVRTAAESADGWLDSHDCVVSAGTWSAAVAAAGLALQAALDLVNGRLVRAFLASRPPSHHAERDRARGYCFFNAVALAAEVIVRSVNTPVLIVDFDALHGNGTQRLFYDRADVGYLSVHRYPFFPGTGGADEVGEGPGHGLNRNIPLAAGADDDVFCTALENGLEEMTAKLRPAAIVVSAGFNAHRDDPLGGMRLTEDGFRRITDALAAASETWSDGRVLSFLEGGFNAEVTARCASAHVRELAVQHPSTWKHGKLLN